jgi:NAD-dependent SIR2 family protein deacetylase
MRPVLGLTNSIVNLKFDCMKICRKCICIISLNKIPSFSTFSAKIHQPQAFIIEENDNNTKASRIVNESICSLTA